jgi:hypothetical protein
MKKIILTLLLIPVSSGLIFCSSQSNKAQTNDTSSVTNKPKSVSTIAQSDPESDQQWRQMTQEEKYQEILSLIDHKMGIAALNQLALEGFTGYDCEKSFYINDYYGGHQTLMRIKCASGRGASVAISFDEVRVIFNRFEGNIESFEIQRIGEEVDQSTFILP